MIPSRKLLVIAAAALGLAAAVDLPAAPRHGHGAGGARPGHSGGYRPSHGGGHHHYGHGGYAYRGWGWGLGLGLALSYPWWGYGYTYAPGWGYPAYYGSYPAPYYGYGPVYRSYGPAYRAPVEPCEFPMDCGRGDAATPPTTQLPPAALAGADGGPTQRPLHLNYCESARAWFPQVQSCTGGWRLVRPEYR